MSYLLLRTVSLPRVLPIVPIDIPCLWKSHEAPPGFVTTLMSWDVPSKTLTHPDSKKLRAHSPATPIFTGCPHPLASPIQPTAEPWQKSVHGGRAQKRSISAA